MNKTKQNVRRQIDQFKEECLRVEKEIDRKNLELAEALKQSQKILLDRVVHQANETIALHRESDTVESECNALMEKLSARNRLLRYTIEQLNMYVTPRLRLSRSFAALSAPLTRDDRMQV